MNANMSIDVRVEEWLRKMGYDGEIPASLPKICNPSTTFIWEQLISNVQPRQEVDIVKKNIIVNRLSKKPLEEQDQFSYPIKEIKIYMEKQKLEKRRKDLETSIEQKEEIIDNLLRKNKVTYMKIENIKARIIENQERKFLLDKKSKIIEKEMEHAQEVLTMARNLTPVEMEASANSEEITKTLQQCAEKLQKLSDEISMPLSNNTKSVSTSILRTAKKTTNLSNGVTFSRFLNQSTILNDIAPTTCKKMNYTNKENINFKQHSTAISRCLKFSDSGDEINISRDKSEKKTKRESLGILNQDCLDASDELDNFLLSTSNMEDSVLQPLTDSLFEPSTNTDNEILAKLRSDKNVMQLLADLLHKNNRHLIMTQCGNIYEQLLKELRTCGMGWNKLVGSHSSKRNIGQSDLTELYFIHVKSELEKEKWRVLLRKQQEAVKRKKDEIMGNRLRNCDDVKEILELQIEDAYLKGANNFLHKQIDSAKKHNIGTDIEVISLKIKQAQEDIVIKINDIQSLIAINHEVIEDIRKNQTETSLCVKKLHPYLQDFAWADKLTQGSNSSEIEIFNKFPLEFNRKFTNGRSQQEYKSVSDTAIPSYLKFDSENLEMVARLLDTPFASAESVIFDALRAKVSSNKLYITKSAIESLDIEEPKISLEELQKKEEYVEPVIDQLESMINSNSVKDVLSAPNTMKEVGDLWLEMPFRNFISEERQVDGHGYKYYEKMLEELRNNEFS